MHCLEILSDEIKTKLHLQKVAGYSLSGAGPPYLVAGYVPGAKVTFLDTYPDPHIGFSYLSSFISIIGKKPLFQ